MIDRSLPLTDLHRHLDGNIRLSTIISLARQHNLPLPSYEPDALRPYVQVMSNEPDLVQFLAKLDWGVSVLADLDACHRVAAENVQDAIDAGIDYAELRFSPYYMAMKHKLPVEGVVEAVLDGVNSVARNSAVRINMIGILSRTFGTDACHTELNALLAHRERIVALDIAGDESGYPGDLFSGHFRKARDAGWAITAHAGEAAGAASIWQAIRDLGAQRIGHGVMAIEDPALMDYLAEHRIGMESCLTSNIQTSTVASLAAHPLKQFLAHGIPATINTDDPAVEGIEIAYEYNIAAPAAGLTRAEIEQAQINGLEIAFLSEQEKTELRRIAAQRSE
ncbi:adenosine deaminase [Morganella psychrotolerans]|uniref:adenosine deaminase n=1 Tax=Morganella psychrotolerans TaxID=368603 RepID=UPI0039B11E27